MMAAAEEGDSSSEEFEEEVGSGKREKKGAWDTDEDVHLLQVVDKVKADFGGRVKWCEVAKEIPSRSPKQCRERYVYNLDPNIRKEPWSKEEDALLIFAQKHLGNAWARIAGCLPGRTENSTKTRFKSILRAQRRVWKKNEDETILKLHSELGSQWGAIATSLTGRSKNAVKNRYLFLSGSQTSEYASRSSRAMMINDSEDGGSKLPRPGSPSQALFLSDFELASMSARLSNRFSEDIMNVATMKLSTQQQQQIHQQRIQQIPQQQQALPVYHQQQQLVPQSFVPQPLIQPMPTTTTATDSKAAVPSPGASPDSARFRPSMLKKASSKNVMSAGELNPETPKNLETRKRRHEMTSDSKQAPPISPQASLSAFSCNDFFPPVKHMRLDTLGQGATTTTTATFNKNGNEMPINNGLYGGNLLLSAQSIPMNPTFLQIGGNSSISMSFPGGISNFGRYPNIPHQQEYQDSVAATKADASSFDKMVSSMFQNKEQVEYFANAEAPESSAMISQPRPSFAEFLLPMVAAATMIECGSNGLNNNNRLSPVPGFSNEEATSNTTYNAGDFEPLPLMMDGDNKQPTDEAHQR